jgi:hypothetical protein
LKVVPEDEGKFVLADDDAAPRTGDGLPVHKEPDMTTSLHTHLMHANTAEIARSSERAHRVSRRSAVVEAPRSERRLTRLRVALRGA